VISNDYNGQIDIYGEKLVIFYTLPRCLVHIPAYTGQFLWPVVWVQVTSQLSNMRSRTGGFLTSQVQTLTIKSKYCNLILLQVPLCKTAKSDISSLAISVLLSGRPSVCPFPCNSWAPNGRVKVKQSQYRTRGFREVEAPRFQDNGTGWW
jgi:hypothetical protein